MGTKKVKIKKGRNLPARLNNLSILVFHVVEYNPACLFRLWHSASLHAPLLSNGEHRIIPLSLFFNYCLTSAISRIAYESLLEVEILLPSLFE